MQRVPAAMYRIDSLKVLNRLDHCQSFVRGIEIQIILLLKESEEKIHCPVIPFDHLKVVTIYHPFERNLLIFVHLDLSSGLSD